MMLVTFDFHNTLARCDTWFELEVHTLASAVAREIVPGADSAALDAAYRLIRRNVVRTGIELDATEGVKQTFASVGISPTGPEIAGSIERLMRHALHDLSAIQGAIETVQHLKQQGYRLGVISSAVHHDFLEWALAQFGILDNFSFVMTSASAGIYKSSPAIYQQAMTITGADPAASLHVGDSLKWDVETASRAGMRTGWLQSVQNHPSKAQPDLVFPTLVDAGPTIDTFMRQLS
jgi:HAD superfamily hydrolase (TIGR01549 family)